MSHPDPLVFLHANGMTPGAYRQLLDPLKRHHQVLAPELAPLRLRQAPASNWQPLADDITKLLELVRAPVVGVGHSIGANTLLMCAATRPHMFQRLVLIEPIVLPGLQARLLGVAPGWVRRHGPLARAARARRDRWGSAREAFEHLRRRRWLNRLSDSVLDDMVTSGVEPCGEGVCLRFATRWEATLYESPADVWPLLRCKLPPITVLRGRESTLLSGRCLSEWRQIRPADEMIEVTDAGHLLPLEHPALVAGLIHREGYNRLQGN